MSARGSPRAGSHEGQRGKKHQGPYIQIPQDSQPGLGWSGHLPCHHLLPLTMNSKPTNLGSYKAQVCCHQTTCAYMLPSAPREALAFTQCHPSRLRQNTTSVPRPFLTTSANKGPFCCYFLIHSTSLLHHRLFCNTYVLTLLY